MVKCHRPVDLPEEGQPDFHEHLHQHGVPEGHGVVVVAVQNLGDGGVGVRGEHPGISGTEEVQ